MKRLFLAVALLAGVFLWSGTASAQTGTARGKVVDEAGKPVADAAVTMELQGGMTRKFQTKSNKKGEYTQVGMQPGQYRVSAAKDGFVGSYVESRISLGEPTYLPDLKLVPKAVAQAAVEDKSMAELKGGFDKANALMNEGKLDEAEAEYRALIAKNPAVPQLHHNLAILLSKKKDMAGAEASYLKAIEVKADYDEGYVGLSNLYLSHNQPDKAVALLTKALAARPDDAKLNFQLGFAQFTAGDYDSAVAALKKAESLDAANPEVHYYLGTIALSRNEKAECAARLEKYLSMNPTNAQNVTVGQGLLQACKGK
jgi:tetratricopeptide (TPR) repeat protein